MTIGELIKKLQIFNSELPVVITSNNIELQNAVVDISFVEMCADTKKEKKTFRDMMDQGSYETEVYSLSGGEEIVIYIG